MSNDPCSANKLPWRIFRDGKYSHVAYAFTSEEAVADDKQRLGQKAALMNVTAEKCNNASD